MFLFFSVSSRAPSASSESLGPRAHALAHVDRRTPGRGVRLRDPSFHTAAL